ncbi:hypothetical protein GCM10010276_22060 [Streptomyces longisporus]|uniref:Uncharacterized protein n=1 Tax=Streptomyces longisporus TaxID=1948 RepID=A0ABN3LGR0_STRLO
MSELSSICSAESAPLNARAVRPCSAAVSGMARRFVQGVCRQWLLRARTVQGRARKRAGDADRPRCTSGDVEVRPVWLSV